MPAADAIGGAGQGSDLARRLAGLRSALTPRPDPDLAASLDVLRATVDPAFARELEAAHRYEHRAAPRERGSGWRKGPPKCRVCKLFLATPGSPCGSCGFQEGAGFSDARY